MPRSAAVRVIVGNNSGQKVLTESVDKFAFVVSVDSIKYLCWSDASFG